jgi:hypothetical protein
LTAIFKAVNPSEGMNATIDDEGEGDDDDDDVAEEAPAGKDAKEIK